MKGNAAAVPFSYPPTNLKGGVLTVAAPLGNRGNRQIGFGFFALIPLHEEGSIVMVAAGGYILQVPKQRRKLLLDKAEHGGSFYSRKPFVSEPVSRFDHSRRAPLAVFASDLLP